ncbi:DUF3243 domain-containing protein [Thermoactinomyces sp. DSM 45892]|uniref:DUF3243 domain-containing protein n=1 Tax=Thermoactinomyces sp. DSM 45892 TaxID=1882753 RepID=UPI000899BDF7|nr:DUF3243 domain-containing protein [Thermoactinomyces sp. DSM 45892]SDY48775.1 Protein of unknown function [Thermoactinomyces sp. DSM 45892]
MSVLDDFQEWKGFLSERVGQARSLGMDDNSIQDIAYELGDYLAKDVQPQNEQELLLRDLWKVAGPEEQKMMAELMVKMVSDGKQ